MVRTSAERDASCSERRQLPAKPGPARREQEATRGVRATVLVRPKQGILDPQGDAVQRSLRKLGFDVSSARIGRVIDLELDADDADGAYATIERMCADLLANPLIESFEIQIDGS